MLLLTNVFKIKTDNNIMLGDKEKLCVCKAHHEQLLIAELDRNDSSLSIEPSLVDLAIKITKDMVAEAVLKIKEGKACGPSGIVIEMVKAGGDAMLHVITDMISLLIKEEQISDDWYYSTIINCLKGKSDVTRCGNYPSLKLLEYIAKVLEYLLMSLLDSK